MRYPFAQALHDRGTLKNVKKYQACSLQFIDTHCSSNFVVEIAFAWSKDGKDTKVYALFTSLSILYTGFDLKYLWVSYVDDGDSQKVTVLISVEARVLLMHNVYKVVASAVVNLIRMKMRFTINPLLEGKNLIANAHKL